MTIIDSIAADERAITRGLARVAGLADGGLCGAEYLALRQADPDAAAAFQKGRLAADGARAQATLSADGFGTYVDAWVEGFGLALGVADDH